jgi:electron transfer flavoprotein alpha subunit
MNPNVAIVAEVFQGRLSDITLELCGKGRELAQSLGGSLDVLLLGHPLSGLVEQLTCADRVWTCDHAALAGFVPDIYEAVLASWLNSNPPRVALLGSTSVGLDLLSPLSARRGLPCLDNCTNLEARDGRLIATCQIYGGKIFAEVALPETTAAVAVVPGAFAAATGGNGKAEVVRIPYTAPASPRMTFRKLLEPPPGDVDITRAPALVSVGRGIQNADNIRDAEELARELGGEVSASRPVIDQGWLPLTRQVGKSGMTVKPKLYLALGISGAPEHLEGMKQSELIVAVNTDPNAPIFSVAHFGAVTDAVELLPLLTAEVRAAKLQKAS